MILRQLGDYHYIVRQPEHARQSGVILAHLREEFLGDMEEQVDLLRSCRHHDDGWKEWEAEPKLQPNGLPLNFCDIDKQDHAENWARTIFGQLLNFGPMAAGYAARHAAALQEVDGAGNPQDRVELIEALVKRVFPDSMEEGTERSIAGFSSLYFCDALSLIPLAGWKERLPLTIQSRDEGKLKFEAWLDGDWKVRVNPWPFCTDSINAVHVDAVCIPRGQEKAAAAILRDPRDYLVRVPIDYVPG